MLCLRRLLAQPGPQRSFMSASPIRPALTHFRLPTLAPQSIKEGPDVVNPLSVSSHPSFCMSQVRFGPRNTMNGHTRLVQKRRHGFLYRMRSRTGRKILLRRRMKGRKQLAQ